MAGRAGLCRVAITPRTNYHSTRSPRRSCRLEATRRCSGWSSAYSQAAHALSDNRPLTRACKHTATAARRVTSQRVQVYVEGPYGSPMIDVHGPRYKCFVVIAGGIGWTFLRSWRRQLLQDARRGRPLKSLTTITVLRSSSQHHAAEIFDSPEICGPLVLPRTLTLEVRAAVTAASPPPVTPSHHLYSAAWSSATWPHCREPAHSSTCGDTGFADSRRIFPVHAPHPVPSMR